MDVRAQAHGPRAGEQRLRQRLVASVASAWLWARPRRISIALCVAFLAALAFARVAEDYVTDDPLARWDVSFARWLSAERTTAGDDVFRVFSFVGSPVFALAVAAFACLLLYRRGRVADAALLPLVLGGAELLNVILKLSFHRTRPEVALVDLDTYSFPSGHAMVSTAAYGALAYLAWGRLGSRRSHGILLAGTTMLVALIGFSRLYLGVHYLSDVLGGAAGGAFWLALSVAIRLAYGDRLEARLHPRRR